ncbi:HelD family protein [Agilicoccus flavus]|uniref:HelD family protein n=1 Tax=Agilicoccus flavus TaxID=2775968 RepID=UPI001CF6D1DC|nr:AAA family ATPase [Agilicoccus flavus]
MPTDVDLVAEQDYLDEVRAQLARMREHALTLDVTAGDPVAAERLAITLWRRARSLEDDGRSAPYFGRIEVDSAHPSAGGSATGWHVGRRHVGDEAGDPLVVDWRAPVSTAFYRASRADPMHVTLRRRFGVSGGRITAMEDEHLQDHADGADDVVGGSGAPSAILAAEIERPRVGPMRDIVATIQPEQDELVRADASTTVCIQGAPGTGKTAVGLHRAAWLLFTFRERLARAGVLVVGPNRAFLDHIGAVLPMLGELDVRHTTAADLVAGDTRIRADDRTEVAGLKGDARLAEVLRVVVWSHVRRPEAALEVPRGTRIWRVPGYDVADTVDELAARGLPYDAARDLLPQRLAHLIMLRMEAAGVFANDDRAQDALAKNPKVRAYARAVWPPVTPAAVLHRLLADADHLAACADGVLEPDEQAALRWPRPPRTPGAARWTPADSVLLDEIAWSMRRGSTYGHVILDEAQDLSPMQLRAVGRRCAPAGAATVLGDIAQGTTPWSTPTWDRSLAHLGRPDGRVVELSRGFRVPADVIAFAARLLPRIAPGLTPPEPVRAAAGSLEVTRADDVVATLASRVAQIGARPGTVGIIVAGSGTDPVALAVADAVGAALGTPVPVVDDAAHDDIPDPGPGDAARVQVVPAALAKGLEYDSVVVLDPAAIVAAEPDERTGLRRLYVVLTRAVSHLLVLHRGDLPAELARDRLTTIPV